MCTWLSFNLLLARQTNPVFESLTVLYDSRGRDWAGHLACSVGGILKSASTSGAIWWEATAVLVHIKKTLVVTTEGKKIIWFHGSALWYCYWYIQNLYYPWFLSLSLGSQFGKEVGPGSWEETNSTRAALVLSPLTFRLPLRMQMQYFFVDSGAAVKRGAAHWLSSASPLGHSPALSLHKNKMPKDTLINSPKWAGLGVEGKGLATFIYTLIEKMSKGQSTPSSAFPSDTDLVYGYLSYQLRLVLRTGFQGALLLPLPRTSINPVAWPWLQS